jgi:hypothetical protein
MVRASSTVFGGCPAEFRECHQKHSFVEVIAAQIIDEGGYRRGKLLEQGAMIPSLVGMIIKTPEAIAAQFGADDSKAQISADQLSD